ncbi:MAG: hypothetical protein P4L74_00740 [Candidatus Doudnabacteria bacterium]|nr:hypothetical protein [Candidatus Doudnabacteria bacterium]
MNLRTQKIITCVLITASVFGGFEALISILNLNQTGTYLSVAFWIFAYLMLMIVLLFDLHIKKPGSLTRARARHADLPATLTRQTRVVFSALWERFEHLRSWTYIRQWIHFLLLPGFIFWSTFSLLYVNLGNYNIQQLLVVLSTIALALDYWFLKEAFRRGREVADADIFATLSMIKIYAIALVYAAALSILRYYCLNPLYFSLEVFGYTFLLIFQALYLHRRAGGKNMAVALLISLIMGIVGYGVYIWWGYNYFTAAVFMAAIYNLLWGTFHYQIDKTLSWRAFWEILVVCVIVVAMVLSVTNFTARISGGCEYYLSF